MTMSQGTLNELKFLHKTNGKLFKERDRYRKALEEILAGLDCNELTTQEAIDIAHQALKEANQ